MSDTGSLAEFDGPAGFIWADGDWRRAIFAVLKKAGVRQVAYVPDAGHTALIEACLADPDMTATVLTTEEEGIGVLAGADLGGERGVMLMQSSGVGNCVNAFSLLKVCGFPFLTLITMRGEWGSSIRGRYPWARPQRRVCARPASWSTASTGPRMWRRRFIPRQASPSTAASRWRFCYPSG